LYSLIFLFSVRTLAAHWTFKLALEPLFKAFVMKCMLTRQLFAFLHLRAAQRALLLLRCLKISKVSNKLLFADDGQDEAAHAVGEHEEKG
jgi:hypothetical protein